MSDQTFAAHEIKPGAVIEVGHPFIREVYSKHDGEGGNCEAIGWRPGTRGEQVSQDDFDMVADAVGTQILTVVSVHKPGKFPARVFYTRRWRDPDGVEFGKTHLRVTVMQSFRTIVRGYRHDYRMATEHNKLERTTEKSMTSVQRPAEAEVNTFSIVSPVDGVGPLPAVSITINAEGRIQGVVSCDGPSTPTISVMADKLTINGHEVSYEMFSSFLAGDWPKF